MTRSPWNVFHFLESLWSWQIRGLSSCSTIPHIDGIDLGLLSLSPRGQKAYHPSWSHIPAWGCPRRANNDGSSSIELFFFSDMQSGFYSRSSLKAGRRCNQKSWRFDGCFLFGQSRVYALWKMIRIGSSLKPKFSKKADTCSISLKWSCLPAVWPTDRRSTVSSRV